MVKAVKDKVKATMAMVNIDIKAIKAIKAIKSIKFMKAIKAIRAIKVEAEAMVKVVKPVRLGHPQGCQTHGKDPKGHC